MKDRDDWVTDDMFVAHPRVKEPDWDDMFLAWVRLDPHERPPFWEWLKERQK